MFSPSLKEGVRRPCPECSEKPPKSVASSWLVDVSRTVGNYSSARTKITCDCDKAFAFNGQRGNFQSPLLLHRNQGTYFTYTPFSRWTYCVIFAAFGMMGCVEKPTPLDEVIQRIGTEIYRRGSYLVSDEELHLIYGGAVDNAERFARIRDIAMRYRWAFELNGRNSSVMFKELPTAEMAISNP